MNSVPILSLIVFVPWFGAVLLALLPRKAGSCRGLALAFSLSTLVLGIAALAAFDPAVAAPQLVERHPWISALNVHYHLGLDGLRQLCASNLMHAIDCASVCGLISHAHRCGARELKDACLDFLLKNANAVDFASLKSEPELMLEVLQYHLRGPSGCLGFGGVRSGGAGSGRG